MSVLILGFLVVIIGLIWKVRVLKRSQTKKASALAVSYNEAKSTDELARGIVIIPSHEAGKHLRYWGDC